MKPFWLLDVYQRKQNERQKLLQRLATPQKDNVIDIKSLLNRPPYPNVNNAYEYSLTYED